MTNLFRDTCSKYQTFFYNNVYRVRIENSGFQRTGKLVF